MSDTSDEPAIRALDEQTVQRIAAGEVVERPASVVKELVENSLDADATRVSVAVDDGGKDGVRVRDDGRGMTEEELRLSVEEHTTSKIEDIDDLEAGVGTLGFRGEALHTIGAVSRMTLRSKPRDSAAAGTELRVAGGEVVDVRPAGCPAGTTVEVEDLFYNTPARKKFLKTDATEFDHVNTVVTQYALANPDVAVSLEHNDREVFATEGNGDLRSTVLSVYGREVAESMVDVATDDPAGPISNVRGLVSHPETTRSGREYLATFVNDRYVRSGALRDAVLDAYGGQLAPDRYPFAVLFVDLPADAVDVNVHPRKMEVRFDDESGVTSAVESAVRDALLDHGLVRSGAPRGRSAPDEADVAPESSEAGVRGGAGTEHERASESTAAESAGTAAESAAEAVEATDATPTRDGQSTSASRDQESTAAPSSESPETGQDTAPGDGSSRPSPRSWQSPENPAREGVDENDAADAVDDAPNGNAPTDDTTIGGAPTDHASAHGATDTADHADLDSVAASDSADAESGVSPAVTQRTLSGEDATLDSEFDSLPRLRVLGQLHDTYIVAETPDGMVLVDQHAADERVNYERLKNEVEGDTPTQALADPVELELTAREAALFEEFADALAQVGFHAGRTGERTVEVRTVPAVFDATLDPALLRDVLRAFVADETEGDETQSGQATVDAVADSLLADLACYPSITGNTSLRDGSVVDLLEALDDCENPFACPHGRPVVIAFDRDEIESRFERDYPGHGGRRRE